MEKNKLIENERIRLAALFIDLPREKFYCVLGLIDQAAFLRVTLDEMQTELQPTDEYKNGANQHGKKISATLQAYNQTEKVYQKLIEQLMQYLPVDRRGKYRMPGADEHEMVAFRNFIDNNEIKFYLSDKFKKQLELDRAKALELMLSGN